MIHSQSAPFILIACILLLTLSGLVTLVWGRRIPRNGDWLVGLFLAALSGGLIFAGKGLIEENTLSKAWSRGWVWPASVDGALTVGVLQDPIGLVMAGLTVILAAVLLGNQKALFKQPRAERFNSAVALAAAGASLSWISLTPWLGFIGLGLVMFSGFLALGSRWESNEESAVAIRFGFQRSFGLLLSVLGACGLAAGRGALIWASGPAGEAVTWVAQGQSLSFSEIAGATLLIAGLCVQFHPFPFLGWVVTPSRTSSWVRLSMAQIFPALTAFAILLRLQAHFGAPSVFTLFGWLMLVSSVLTVICGMLQSRWELALGAWTSAGTALAVAMLCLVGPRPALSLMIAFSLGAIAFASIQSTLSHPASDEAASGTQNPVWAKIVGFAAICAATGVIGFVSSGGGLQWVLLSWYEPAQAAAALSVFALFAVLGWKLAWTMGRTTPARPAHWSAIALPLLLVLLALGILWTGAVSGGVLPGGVDKVTLSLMDLFFKTPVSLNGEDASFVPATGAYWGSLILAIIAAYWASVQIKEPAPKEEGGFSLKLYRFILSGYGTDQAMNRGLIGLTWIAERAQILIEGKLWDTWFPRVFSLVIRRTAEAINRADAALTVHARRVMRHWIDAPAKFLQLIQNGDVQWYLLFAVGSGLAILAHFLWIAGGSMTQ